MYYGLKTLFLLLFMQKLNSLKEQNSYFPDSLLMFALILYLFWGNVLVFPINLTAGLRDSWLIWLAPQLFGVVLAVTCRLARLKGVQKTCSSERGVCQVVWCDDHPRGQLIFISETLFPFIIWSLKVKSWDINLPSQLSFAFSIELPSACLAVPVRAPNCVFR